MSIQDVIDSEFIYEAMELNSTKKMHTSKERRKDRKFFLDAVESHAKSLKITNSELEELLKASRYKVEKEKKPQNQMTSSIYYFIL